MEKPLWFRVTTVICVSIMIVVAGVGNLLVLLSYCRDPRLRSIHNLYVLNMAICELTAGLVCMPILLILKVGLNTWLGAWGCKMFLSTTFIVFSMSIDVIVMLAWDRLAMLRHWAAYETVETRSKAYTRLGVGWGLCFLINFPPTFLWDVVTGVSVLKPGECNTEYRHNLPFTVFLVCILTVVPVLILGVLHGFIFVALRKRFKMMHDNSTVPTPNAIVKNVNSAEDETTAVTAPTRTASEDKLKSAENGNSSGAPLAMRDLTASSPAGKGTAGVGAPYSSCADSGASVVEAPLETSENQENKVDVSVGHPPAPEPVFNTSITTPFVSASSSQYVKETDAQGNFSSNNEPSDGAPPPSPNANRRSSTYVTGRNKEKDCLQQETPQTKAKRMALLEMGLVLIVAITWGPFLGLTILRVRCNSCVHPLVYDACTWLLLLKSCLDPMLYAYASPRFRLNFVELLDCVWFVRQAGAGTGTSHSPK